MKKGLITLLVFALLVSSVFAQGTKEDAQATSSDSKVTLTFWSEYATPERTAYVEAMAKAYEEAHPNVTIKVTSLPDKAAKKVLAAYEAGEGPDVFLSSGPDVSAHYNNDYIIALDDYFNSWDEKDNFLSGAIDTVKEYDLTGENHILYIPNGISVTTIWTRSDWLKEAGYPDGIKTWEDFFDSAVKMTDKSKDRYGLAIRGGSGGSKFLDRMMYSYSGIDSLFDENGKCTINNPKHVEFVERYFGLYGKATAEGDLNYGWTELSAAFDSGKAGIIIHNLGSAEDHDKAFNGDLTKFAAMGMPLNDKGESMNLMIQPGGMTISKTCKNPDIAWDFIAFMSTGDQVDEYARLWGSIPVYKPVLETSDWIYSKPWFEAAAELLLNPSTKYYKSYKFLPNISKIYSEMDTESQYVMTGQMTAKEMLDNWAKMLQDSYDTFVSSK